MPKSVSATDIVSREKPGASPSVEPVIGRKKPPGKKMESVRIHRTKTSLVIEIRQTGD